MMKGCRLLVFTVALNFLGSEARAGCGNLIWKVGETLNPLRLVTEKVDYKAMELAISNLDRSIQKIRELDKRPWKSHHDAKLVEMIIPGSKVPLSEINKIQDWSDLQNALVATAEAIDILSSKLDHSADRLLKSTAGPLLHLIVRHLIYGDSYIRALRLVERFREAPDYLAVRTPQVELTLKNINPKNLDARMIAAVKRLQSMTASLSSEVALAVDDYLASGSTARFAVSVTIQPKIPNDEDPAQTAADWKKFETERKTMKTELSKLEVPPLKLPDANRFNLNQTPVNPNSNPNPNPNMGLIPLVESDGAQDSSESARSSEGVDTSTGVVQKSQNGLIQKSERAKALALASMPAKQRAAFLANQAMDTKLKAARQNPPAAAKPAE